MIKYHAGIQEFLSGGSVLQRGSNVVVFSEKAIIFQGFKGGPTFPRGGGGGGGFRGPSFPISTMLRGKFYLYLQC